MDKLVEDICDSALWDPETVKSKYPDFTPCFQNTYLKWFPCLIFWLMAPLWLFKLLKRTQSLRSSCEFSVLFLLKLMSIVLLIAIEVFHLSMIQRFNRHELVYFITPLVLTSTYLLVVFTNYLEYRTRQKYSVVLFIYWLISTLFSIVPLRSLIINHEYFNLNERSKQSSSDLLIEKIISIILFILNSTCLILSAISYRFNDENKEENSIKDQVSILSFLTFWWTNPVIKIGYKGNLTHNDLWKLDDKLKSKYLTEKLESKWLKASQAYLASLQYSDENGSSSATAADDHVIKKSGAAKNRKADDQIDSSELKALNGTANENGDCSDTAASSPHHKNKIKKPWLGTVIMKVYLGQFLNVLAIKIFHDVLSYTKPAILDKLITFIKEKDQSIQLGAFYVFLLCLISFTQSIIGSHYHVLQFLNGSRVKFALMNMIYKKSFKLNSSSRKTVSIGEMTNLLTNNASTFERTPYHLINIISVPLQLFLASFMLWKHLGVATLAGMAILIILIPLNTVFTSLSKKITRKKYVFQDKRIKMMNEIFSGIRVVKFYGWELSFKRIIKFTRIKEMKNLFNASLISTISTFIWESAPFLVAALSFTFYLLINSSSNIDPNKAFVSLTLFAMLRMPLQRLPIFINGLIQVNVSMGRIREFLLKDEANTSEIAHLPDNDLAIKIESCSFGWDKSNPVLKNINFSMKHGEMVAVVGKVGSGKSSILSAILGEMHKLKSTSTVNVFGRIAYVPQQAWIQNKTFKENILFGCQYDHATYNRIIRACSLKPDLELMPAHDETEIGEKGINLSGGQKQRVSLARSIYSDADIYLLDDPLSAVDSHVGKHIFDSVLCSRNGLLKNKTRLFVTNSLNFLPRVDRVLVVDNGEIVEMGSYDELMMNEKSALNDFMQNFHIQQQQAAAQNQNQNNQKKQQKQRKESTNNQTLLDDEDEQEIEDKTALNRLSSIRSNDSELSAELDVLINKIEDNKDFNNLNSNINNRGKITQQEKIESGRVKLSVAVEYFKACKIYLSVAFVSFYVLNHVFDVSCSFWLSAWADESKNKTIADSNKFYRLGVYSTLGIIGCLCTLVASLSFLMMYIKATNYLHNKMLHSVLRAPLRFFEATPTGRILNRFTHDIQITEGNIPESVNALLSNFLSLLSIVVVISRSTPWFLTAAAPIFISYFFVQRYFVPSNRQIKRMNSASRSPIYSHFAESQTGVSTIKAYNNQTRFIKHMENNIDKNFRVTFAETASNRWLNVRLEIIANLITICSATFAILTRSSITAGLAGMSISVSLNITQTLSMLVRTVSDFEANITSVERIKEYCDLKHEAEWTIEEKKPPVEWPQHGEIVFKDFSLKYRAELDNVLENLNIHVKPGEKIGICGRTGAGKSSLTMGLFRILEITSGDIIIDNVNINEIGLHDLRHKLTIIPQDPIIFSGTLRMNLDPFEAYSDDKLWSALELSYLKEFVMSLENKLDYECTEGGENLSVGQRQLICLARALLRKTKILILDEATASVDHNTDELIQKTIRDSFADCTVLTIAHRLNTIMDYTRIIVLDKGRIVEFDEPKKLLENKSSQFYSMAKSAKLV